MLSLKILFIMVGCIVSVPAIATPGMPDVPSSSLKSAPGVLLAQNAASKGGKGGRKRILTGEARGKASGTKTNIDFDAASIDGERRIPAGVAVSGVKQEHEYDLINLRLRWHPEMVKSTSNLETGKGP